MTASEITNWMMIGMYCLIAGFLAYQVRKIWRIRYLLKNFLDELKKLNVNVGNVVTYIRGKSGEPTPQGDTKPICANCIFRQTFLVPGSLDLLAYKCKIDKRIISLEDTCKRFQRDFQDSNIE